MVPKFQPLPLSRSTKSFSDPDWLFEIKWDGFRALAQIENGQCRLMSRNANQFESFATLNLSLALECRAKRPVLDGEIVTLDETGNSQFRNLLFRRGEPRFYAFDLLWCDGEDLRFLPLSDRKHRLHGIVPSIGERLLYCDHLEGMGTEFFQLACERDLEGIVAKRKFDSVPDRWQHYLVEDQGGSAPCGSAQHRAPYWRLVAGSHRSRTTASK